MKTIPRRAALLGACASVATLLTKAEAVAENPQLAGIQALVSNLRNVDRSTPMCVYVAFQETADRLETLPGIVPVKNEHWHTWKSRIGETRTGLGSPRRHLTPVRNKSSRLVCMSAQRAGPPDGLTSNGP